MADPTPVNPNVANPNEPNPNVANPNEAAADLDRILGSRRSGRRRWPWLLAAATLVLLGFWFFRGSAASTPASYRTVVLEKGDLAASVTATGQLQPTNQVDVGSELSGTVEQVLVDTNDLVEAGQVLAVLDTTKLEQQTEKSRAALLAAEARVAQAEASLAQHRADLSRFEEVARLSDGKVPAKTEMDAQRATLLRAEAELKSAQASVAEARSTLRANESDLKKGAIRSPIRGIVLDRGIEPGQTVAASFQSPVLFTLAEDLKRMELTVDVAEADVGLVAAGQPAQFTVDAWPGKRYDAAVLKVRFGSKVVENVVSYEAELAVANDDLSLRPGMTATADIKVAERREVWLVPNAALRFNPPATRTASRTNFSLVPRPPSPAPRTQNGGDQPKVYVLEQGQPRRVEVTVGLSDGKKTEIASPDLKPGTEIIVETLGGQS